MELVGLDALLFQLLGGGGEAGVGLAVLLNHLVLDLELVDEVAAKVGLAEGRAVLVIRVGQLRHRDVRLDAAFLHRPARRREVAGGREAERGRSEEHTSELQSLMRISYAVFCLKKKKSNRRIIIS